MTVREVLKNLKKNESNVIFFTVEILAGDEWLNTDIISFYIAHLETVTFKDHPEILFLQPSQTQVVKLFGVDGAISVLEPLQSQSKEVIICVVNDSVAVKPESNTSKGTGGHWSVVAYSKKENCFYSLDSAGSTNWQAASEVMRIMKKALRCTDATIIETPCLRQDNAYDCGVYSLANAELIASHFVDQHRLINLPLLSAETAKGKRAEILDLVLKLSTEMKPEAVPEQNVLKLSTDIEPVPEKKLCRFILLSTLHSELTMPANSSREVLNEAERELQIKMANADHSMNARGFAVDSNLVIESIVAKLNSRMEDDAVNVGNVVLVEMLKSRVVEKKDPEASHDEYLMVS